MTLTSQVECDGGEVACMLGMPGGNEVGIVENTENEISETLESSKANACNFLNCTAVHCNLEAFKSIQPPLECDLSSVSLTHISPQAPLLNGSTDVAFSKVLAAAQSDPVVGETCKVDTSILYSADLEDGDLFVHDATEELKALLDVSQLCKLMASSPQVAKGQEIDHFSRTVKADGIPFTESTFPLDITYSESCLSNTKTSEHSAQDTWSSLTARGDLSKSFTSNLLHLHEDGSLGYSLNKVDTAEDRCPQTESDRQHLLQLKENDLQTKTPHTENRSTSSCKDQENRGETDLIVKKEEYICNFILPSGDESQSLIFSEEEKKERLSIHMPAEADTLTMPKISRSMSPVISSSAVTWVTPIMLLEKSTNTSVACEAVRCGILSPVSQRSSSTSITPVTRSCAVTWVTPIALLERSMNTSGDFSRIMGKGETCVKDSAAETDSLLWNFSRENLNSMSKNELENHLEHTLIIIEALSRQLQDWQRNGGLVTHLGPSEQRETFTQTDETHATQEKYHYNLYVKAVEKINSLQNSKQDEERLKKELQTAFESLKSLYDTSLSTFESAEKIYRMTQEAKKAMSQDVCRIREFLSKHTKLLQKISVKMQGCLQLREEMKSQLEEAIQTKEAVCAELENLITQNEQIILERKRLAAELASLMTESSQVRARNEHYVVELSSREARIKILEQAQTEERERLKQLLSDTQRQKHELQDQIYQLETCNEQIDDLQTQLSDYAKNRELLEEENYVCREQLIEIEKQLKSSLSLIWESNLQREEQKDTIQQLQKIKETLQEELDTTKAEARDMLLKMGKEISDSFGQITRMKEKLLDLSGSLKAALHEEDLAADNSVTRTPARFAIHTPTSSFVGSVLKAAQREAESDNEEEKSDGPMSEKSAFTKVQPTTPKVPDFEVSLPDILFELRGIIANLSITASQLLQNKTQEIHKLKKELSDLQDKQWKLNSQYTTEISNLKEEFINLKWKRKIGARS
ncbi:sperm-associated antigen 5 [Microcaecilia unicolor]|uniref:Sperm-associated antigen 5 n=1 Tax=Microcaecilia unicolor TaxID=1415580 RepID=A0A6P7ZVH9_9AMPH|nr:sperm-associated antigen 5 [Microcaecilia unicolor]